MTDANRGRSAAGAFIVAGGLLFAIISSAFALGPVSGVSEKAAAFIVPAICYALLCGFALAAARAAVGRRENVSVALGH